jgi:choline dehydrogenase-like flavoprotein
LTTLPGCPTPAADAVLGLPTYSPSTDSLESYSPLQISEGDLVPLHPAPLARAGAAGRDPQTSVADGRRQLHDLPGVWVGDASALPTAPGVNPMITLMALAELTAQHMIGAG